MAGHRVPWWAIAASIVATETSTVTFISVPGIAWATGGDFRFLQLVFGYLLARVVISTVFMPWYFRGELVTVYELLQTRFAPSVKALVKENLVSFTLSGGSEPGLDNALIGSRFIEGEFPKYRQLLPEGYPNALTVEKDALLDVTKRVGLLAQNNLPLKLRLGSELEISAHTPDVGEGQEVLDASFDGESLVIAFNPQFLYDGVSAIRSEEVVVQVGDGLKPAIIQAKDDSTFTYLLMPVRLS